MSPPGPRARSALTLYSQSNCRRSHTIRFVMGLKGLPHDLIVVDGFEPPSELRQLQANASLPTLVERDVVLFEPRIIAEYLDERFPHPPLLPSDPLGRARMRLTVHRIESEWGQGLDGLLAGSSADPQQSRQDLRNSLAESEALFKAAKFFLSPDVGIADCVLLPILWRLPAVGIGLKELPPGIDSYAQRLFQTPLFQRSLTDAERAQVGAAL